MMAITIKLHIHHFLMNNDYDNHELMEILHLRRQAHLNPVDKITAMPRITPQETLKSVLPVQGEFSAFMVGLAFGSIFHEGRYGLEWVA